MQPLSVRETLRLERALLQLHMNLGSTMPWSLYEAQNRKARESYHRRRYQLETPAIDHSLPHVRCKRYICRRLYPARCRG